MWFVRDFSYNGTAEELARIAERNNVRITNTVIGSPDGARVAKKKIWDGVTSYNHKYIVDISGKVPVVLLVLDAGNGNAIVKTYIHANGQVLAQHNGGPSAARCFYLHDRLGSVRQVIDNTGTVVNCYTYDPWGLPVGSETQETISNLYRFAGYVWDAEILQYHCFRRQYDPVLGRFTSRDPVEGDYQEPMTLHKYLYCLNNPINKTDPSGEFWGAIEQAKKITYGISAYYTGLDEGLKAAGGDPWAIMDVAIAANEFRESYFKPENLSKPVDIDIRGFFGDLAGACDWGKLALCITANTAKIGAQNSALTTMCVSFCTIAVATREPYAIRGCAVCFGGWGVAVVYPCVVTNCRSR